jgi:hypothetical protein
MKKKIIVCILVLCVLLLTCCDSLLPWNGSYSAKYVVTGTAPTVNLTIENSSGGTSQYSSKTLPWEYEFSGSVSNYGYDFLYVSAQNNSSSGSVTAQIYVKKSNENDYSLWKTSTSNGSYVIATASTSISK